MHEGWHMQYGAHCEILISQYVCMNINYELAVVKQDVL